MHELVLREVDDSEVCIRCICSPLHVKAKTGTLKREAFLPPPNKREVSLLRLRYTDLNFAKSHAKSLKLTDQTYWGLASIVKSDIKSVQIEDDAFSVDILGTPISKDKKYIPVNISVYSDDEGLPMHADLIYSEFADANEVKTQMRKFANILVKIAKHRKDDNVDQSDWSMGDFTKGE